MAALAGALGLAGLAGIAPGLAGAETGQIGGEAIEVDGDLFASDPPVPSLGSIDWVEDPDEPNTGTGCLDPDGVVRCNEADLTARPGGTGSWHGLRILDGLVSDDDIYGGGSKFEDPSTWTVITGNVGSSKFDASEVFLANNADTLYFAMLRLGNNGTTAFDFEFNRLAPIGPYQPNRSEDDLLLVFELQGSGQTGDVEIFAYRWRSASDSWDPIAVPASAQRAINQQTEDGPAWGVRDSKGVWGDRHHARFTFAEVGIPIGPGGIEPPVDAGDCSQSAWVSIRTRASNEFTSAMKDAFDIVEYEFSGLTVAAAKTAESAADLTMTVSSVVSGAGGGSPGLQWQAFDEDTQTWQDLAGETNATLVLDHDDPLWTAALPHSQVLTDPFGVEDLTFVGRLLRSQVRVVASQTVGETTCDLESNAVTLAQLIGVDP